MKLLILFLLVLKLSFIICDSSCNAIKKCGECIGNPYDKCVWCAQVDLKEEFHRCESKSNLNSTDWCKDHIVDPKYYLVNTARDADNDWNVDDNKVQFRPLEMKIKARPGVPVPFTVSYKPVQHYPLDVYFLIDNSYTMLDYKKELKTQAYAIHTKLSEYTNNVQFGIGTFIEKPAFPYFDANSVNNAYSFEHHLEFTKNITLFGNVMDNTPFGSNYDDPEAGLDALMQVMVCDIQLKWRKNSRRFIVLFADSTYHSAGDGKMIGIMEPNDMQCHLENNSYSKSLEQDYPSVSQIKKAAYDGSFKIIFAATDNVRLVYKALAESIGSARYTKLQSNIVDLIVEQYRNAVDTVDLETDFPPYIDIKTDQNCKAIPKVNCGSTHDKLQVDINVNLTVKSCQKNSKGVIGPSGLRDKLIIHVEIDCECECEKQISSNNTSHLCSNGGAMQCGICKCDKDRYGSICECSGNSTDTQDMEKCKQNVNDTKYCKGNGECQCGLCKCDNDNINGKFTGPFCQYNIKYCPGPSNLKCSGNGKCEYNECQCYDGFINTNDRKDCSCAVGDELCRAPYSEEVCSGYGKCECGKCICNKISADRNDTYLGKYCDSSDEYNEKRCKELDDYAYCNYLQNQKICDSKTNKTYYAEVILLNKTDYDSLPFGFGITPVTCKKTLDDGRFLLFKYYYEQTEEYKLNMRIQNELETPPKANIYIAVGSAVGAVILIGLVTLIGWKILVDLHDKREYLQFADEAAAAGYNVENPLYQKPTHSFSNPTWNSTENL